ARGSRPRCGLRPRARHARWPPDRHRSGASVPIEDAAPSPVSARAAAAEAAAAPAEITAPAASPTAPAAASHEDEGPAPAPPAPPARPPLAPGIGEQGGDDDRAETSQND